MILAYGFLPFSIIATIPRRVRRDASGHNPARLAMDCSRLLWPSYTILLDLLVVIPVGILVLALAVDRHETANLVNGPPADGAGPPDATSHPN